MPAVATCPITSCRSLTATAKRVVLCCTSEDNMLLTQAKPFTRHVVQRIHRVLSQHMQVISCAHVSMPTLLQQSQLSGLHRVAPRGSVAPPPFSNQAKTNTLRSAQNSMYRAIPPGFNTNASTLSTSLISTATCRQAPSE